MHHMYYNRIGYLAVLLFFVLPLQLYAQEQDTSAALMNESEINRSENIRDIHSLYRNYYDNSTFLNHSFDYEIKNKIKSLRSSSKDVLLAGALTEIGLLLINALLVEKYDWSLWIDIPCVAIVGTAVLVPFIVWQDKLLDQASALEQQTAYLVDIGDNIDMGITMYASNKDMNTNAIGLGIKFSF